MDEFRIMENGVITLKEALEIFKRKDVKGRWVPFSISFRTFSRTTKKGGALKSYPKAVYLPSANEDTITTRNPNHHVNRTRNIELPNGDIKKVNIDFIISVNNQTVIY